jgi:hypothetical protein
MKSVAAQNANGQVPPISRLLANIPPTISGVLIEAVPLIFYFSFS